VDIRLESESEAVVISVSDDGMDLPPRLRDGGKGLPNMKRRAERIGGT